MSLIFLTDNWKQFGKGRKWRCTGPKYICEVDDRGNTPNYIHIPETASKIRRIKSVYAGRIKFGLLDEMGTGLDILVANSLTESFGTVPSPISTQELRNVNNNTIGIDPCVKLDEVIRYVAARAKYLERREPGYVNPVNTPGRISAGAHHVLISTARSLIPSPANAPLEQRIAEITDLICRLPAESLYAADFAVRYFNRNYPKHLNQPPLLAATYNAGSPRPDPANIWNLRQYGQHIDRWITYYNTSRML